MDARARRLKGMVHVQCPVCKEFYDINASQEEVYSVPGDRIYHTCEACTAAFDEPAVEMTELEAFQLRQNYRDGKHASDLEFAIAHLQTLEEGLKAGIMEGQILRIKTITLYVQRVAKELRP